MVSHYNVWVRSSRYGWESGCQQDGDNSKWRGEWMDGRKVEEKQQKQYNNTEWENWRERWRQEWMEGGLAGVGRGMLPDHCKEGGVGQVSHQLQPWPSSLLLSLSLTHTHFLLHSTILPLPLILPWPLSSAPINQSLLPLFLPLAFSHLPPPTMPLIPPDSSPSFHRWKCGGSRKVRGG